MLITQQNNDPLRPTAPRRRCRRWSSPCRRRKGDPATQHGAHHDCQNGTCWASSHVLSPLTGAPVEPNGSARHHFTALDPRLTRGRADLLQDAIGPRRRPGRNQRLCRAASARDAARARCSTRDSPKPRRRQRDRQTVEAPDPCCASRTPNGQQHGRRPFPSAAGPGRTPRVCALRFGGDVVGRGDHPRAVGTENTSVSPIALDRVPSTKADVGNQTARAPCLAPTTSTLLRMGNWWEGLGIHWSIGTFDPALTPSGRRGWLPTGRRSREFR